MVFINIKNQNNNNNQSSKNVFSVTLLRKMRHMLGCESEYQVDTWYSYSNQYTAHILQFPSTHLEI